MGLAKTFLAIGIAVILAVFISYALYTIYQPPKYYNNGGSNNCSETYDCQKQLHDCQAPFKYGDSNYQQCSQSAEYKSCLELRDKCSEEYKKTTPRYVHSRNSFYILIILGIAAIIAGILLSKLEGIGSGIMGGGVLIVLWSLIYTHAYWFTLNKYVKLIALAIVLVILIYFGYKKLENKIKK